MTPTPKPDAARLLLGSSLRKAPYLFGFLLALTALLLMWHHFGMERVIELSARSAYVSQAGSDRESGGSSGAQLTRVGDDLRLACQLAKMSAWPYCKISFEVGNADAGLDLSTFDSVSIDATYEGPGQHMLRMTLINFDRGMSKPGEWTTNKFNEVESFDIPREGEVEFPLSIFSAASWWKGQAKPPLAFTGARIDHVMTVQLLTGALTAVGNHVITVRSIRFHGKLITKNQLLSILIGMWIACAIGWPALLALKLRRELSSSKAELRLLNELNRALRLETQQLAGQAHHDPLTGVLNREGLRAELMATSTLLSDPMSVIFLDIDHFKRINDSYGHEVGDLVLKQFAATVAANVRASDRLVRWGGEEFLLLCPLSDVHQAASLAEKLRVSLTQASWPHGHKVTASFGVAQHDANEEISDVIRCADHELYQAKQCGRNRVHADTGAKAGARAAQGAGAVQLA